MSALLPVAYGDLILTSGGSASYDNKYPEFTLTEIIEASKTLPNGKALGPDNIPNKIVKSATLSNPLRFKLVFDNCLKDAVFPSIWNKAYVVLLPKPGRPLEDPSSYRPLCMLDTAGKLLEKLLVKRL